MKSSFWRRAALMAGITVTLLVLCFLEKALAEKIEPRWSIFAYGGTWTESNIRQIMETKVRLHDSYVWTAGFSRSIHDLNDFLRLELELNAAQHTGYQDHFELNAALNLRWHKLPWNHYVKTSLSYGLGPSYAFHRPPLEQKSSHDPTPAHLLVFMPVEVTFGPPERYQLPWEILVRVHHRSGAFGLVSNASGSNFIAGGLRYRF